MIHELKKKEIENTSNWVVATEDLYYHPLLPYPDDFKKDFII